MSKHNKEIVGGLTAAVAAVAGAQVAHAADAYPPAADWSGPYIGISLGLEGGQTPVGVGSDYHMSGANFGGFIGVNHQMGNFVIGAELALQSGVNGDTDGISSYNDAYRVNYTADSKVKLGVALSPQTLIYGFGGVSAGTVKNYDAAHDYGWVAANFGVGAEYKVSDNFSLGIEGIARAPISPYKFDGDPSPGISYQGTLRAAFHF